MTVAVESERAGGQKIGAGKKLQTYGYAGRYATSVWEGAVARSPAYAKARKMTTETPGSQQVAHDVAESMVAAATDMEPRITADITSIAAHTGATMHGLDFRIKQNTERIAEKILETSAETGMTLAESSMKISDPVRYTFHSSPDEYVTAFETAHTELLVRGYKLRVKNYWPPGDAYNGVNVALTSPDGVPVEVQFHTPDSQRIKDQVHVHYEEYRKPSTPRPRKQELWHKMISISDGQTFPPDWERIPGIATQPGPPALEEVPSAPLARAIGGSGMTWRWFLLDHDSGPTVYRLSPDTGDCQVAKGAEWVDASSAMERLITDPQYREVSEPEAFALISRQPPQPEPPSGPPRERSETMTEQASLIIAESGWHLRADGRSVEGRIVPFNEPAMVSEHGEVFAEQFLPGCLERMCQIATKRGNAGWIGLNLDHDDAFDKLIGYATSIQQRNDGGYASFRLYAGPQLDKVRSMLLESHTGLSVMFGDITAPRDIEGIRSRVQIHVSHVAATPAPVYSGAAVLALRSGAPEVDRPALREWEQWLADNARPPVPET